MDDVNDLSGFAENLSSYSTAADMFNLNGTPTDGQIALVAGNIGAGLLQQWGEALKNPGYWMYAANVLGSAAMNLPANNNLLDKAKELYPKKANKYEMHHVDPQYMGGDKNGTMVRLNGSYHQLITNEFRKYHPYGAGHLPAEQRKAIMNKVYKKYPLP